MQTHYTKIVQDLMKGFEPPNSPLGTPLNTTTSSPIYRTRKLYLKHNQKGHHIRRRVLLRTKDSVIFTFFVQEIRTFNTAAKICTNIVAVF